MFHSFRKACKEIVPGYEKYLEEPKQGQADLALPCFIIAKEKDKKPHEISKEIASSIRIQKGSLVLKVEAFGPYVNFFINYEEFSPLVLKEAIKENYGKSKIKKERILIESPGPNTNKPLHLGHIRNMALGMSLSNILKFSGYDVKNVDIINDRGVHICKSMLAYEKFGKGRNPDKKGDHFVGDFYVLFAKELEKNPEAQKELRQMLVDWENNNKKVIELWKKMNSWALEGIKETYKRFGMHIDKTYFESEHYLEGKKIAYDAVSRGIFYKDEEGNIIADLDSFGLGKRVVVRSDDTTVYLTQDIALAKKRYKDFKMDKMIYVVGSEQIDHFRALFKIFEILGYPFAKNCFHMAYGMVNLPEGKMKSREGTVVDADDLLDSLQNMAKEEIKKREPDIKEEELKQRAEKIGLSALKFFILKFDAIKTITYDPKSSLSFEGDTGPYLMYTYARAKSIIRKSGKKAKISYLGNESDKIVKLLSLFPEKVNQASREYKPHIIANYAIELASAFNEYYHSTKILNSDKEEERLAIVEAVLNVLKNCLYLLGIETIEKM